MMVVGDGSGVQLAMMAIARAALTRMKFRESERDRKASNWLLAAALCLYISSADSSEDVRDEVSQKNKSKYSNGSWS
jgi:hypothetical protein